jgi:hypothetical protein
MAERRVAAGISLSEDRYGAYAVKINICRPGTVAGTCTLTDAVVPVGGSEPCRSKQAPRKPEAK